MTCEVAWAAGLFEGEGTIVIYGKGGRRVNLALASTDLDVVARFCAIVGAGSVGTKSRRNMAAHHKTQYQWMLGNNAEVVRVLTLLRPWLGDRRGERADQALDLLRYTRVHCAKGHPKPLDSKGCARCSEPWVAAQAARRREAR